jgi:hypothetical protein
MARSRIAREIVIDEHFVGPPGITLGSYVGGLAAGYLESPCACVSMQAPTPMGRPISVDSEPGRVRFFVADTLLIEATPATLDLDIPAPIDLAAAKRASLRHAREMPYPDCFGCGSNRSDDDGLHLRSGPVVGQNLVAIDWRPRPLAVGAEEGAKVPSLMTWAALECPLARALDLPGMKTADELIVLGRMTARIDALPRVGREHFFMAWPLERVGRRLELAGSLHDADGALLAAAALTFVLLKAGVSYTELGGR